MTQIAMKFVQWDVPELEKLKDSKVYDFSDVLKRYFVKQHGHIAEYYAIDKTALRSVLYGRIEDIIEVQ